MEGSAVYDERQSIFDFLAWWSGNAQEFACNTERNWSWELCEIRQSTTHRNSELDQEQDHNVQRRHSCGE